MYEVLRLHVDATAKRCQGCARKRRALEDARAAYAAALKAVGPVTWYADPSGRTEIEELRAAGLAVLMGFILRDVRLRYVESMRRTLSDTAAVLATLLESETKTPAAGGVEVTE